MPHHNEPDLDTLPKLLRKLALQYGDRKIAMRVKDMGIWKSFTWQDYYDKVRDLCLGLVKLGFQRDDKICIIGENNPEWFWAELAAQSAGGVAIGVFTDCQGPEVKYFFEHSDSCFVVAHDQEQVDKVLEIKTELKNLKKIIYWDPKGLWAYEEPDLLSMEDVMQIGRELNREKPELYDDLVDQGRGDDVAEWAVIDGWYNQAYEYLSFIPPAWATEQALGISGALVAGMTVNFPEEPETVQENIREIGPHVMFYGARLWESVNSMVQARMMDSTRFRRWLYHRCLPIALQIVDLKIENRPLNLWQQSLGWLVYQGVFRALRDRLGFSRAKVIYSAGGAVSPEIIRFFLALGVEIKLFYGSTEMGIISVPRPAEIRPETSGRPMPWAEVKIAADGEIMVKSKYLYAGYYKNPAATAKNIKDGYYCSGDFGHIDGNGHLIVIDRMEDLKPLAGDRQFSPQYCEVRLRYSPYIKDALVVGNELRDYVAALINIDLDNVGRYAEANHISYTTFTDLSQKPEVVELANQEIRRINRTLPDHARIRRFVNLHKEFDADEAELTRTRKLRRTFVEDRYRDLIQALYSEINKLDVEAEVTYRDGRTGVIRTSILVNDVQ